MTDAALVAGKVTADALAKRPGIQASLDSLKMRFTTGKSEVHKTTDYVYENADNIIALLNSKAVHIKSWRLMVCREAERAHLQKYWQRS